MLLTVETGAAERLENLEREVASLRAELGRVKADVPANRASLLVVSGDYERIMVALMLAHTAAALDMEVSMFFALWGVQAIKKSSRYRGKSLIEKGLTAMLKPSHKRLPASKFNFAGMGPVMFEYIMKTKRIATPAELMAAAGESRIRLLACTTSLDMFGIGKDELCERAELCGAASFLETVSQSKIALLI